MAGDWPNPSRSLHTGRLTVPTRCPLNGPEVPVEAKPCDRAKRHKPRRRVAEGTIGGLMRCRGTPISREKCVCPLLSRTTSVSVLTSLKVAVNQGIMTGKRFFYLMRSDHRSLSAGEVARKVSKY